MNGKSRKSKKDWRRRIAVNLPRRRTSSRFKTSGSVVEVRWLRTALANLDAEAEYVARDNARAALRLVERIYEAVEQLKQYPSLGRVGRVPGTRELVVPHTPYLVPYRVREDVVEILRVLHGARRWPTHL